MMQWALTGYADTATTGAAWDAIFRHFNGGAAYQPGEKVLIKVNLTTSNSPNGADTNYDWDPSACGASWISIGQSPQLMVALLDQLVNVVGVAQSDITIGDSTGLWVNELYNILHGAFPDVNYMDARGTLGRTLSTRSTVPLYWSASERTASRPGLPPAGGSRRQVRDQLRHPQEPPGGRNHRNGQEPFWLTQRR